MTSTARNRYRLIGRSPHDVEQRWLEAAGQPPETDGDPGMTFTPTGDDEVTLVTVHGDGAPWPPFVDALAADVPAADPTELWFLLQHSPGAATPPSGVFASPDFGLHVQFLRSLMADGVLVAGGPLPDQPGAGLTVVRVFDLATAQRVITAAQESDGAVLTGLLDLEIRPWQVRMSTVPSPST